jgi:MFS family permease
MLVAQLMLILDATVVQVALPHIRADLHFSPTNLLWVVNGYALPYGGLLQTTQQFGAATGLAVVVTVYASHAVPGRFLPGTSAALLTAAGFSALALLIALIVPRRLFSGRAHAVRNE